MLADHHSRQLIETSLDQNLLVEAAAGSGKTESLARRMAHGIITGRYRVQDIAAVTFTRKAAGNLRDRFQTVLENRLINLTDPTERERVETALSHLESLFAGTIHSFCARLLRERPVEAGVSPGFEELDEAADAALIGRVWRRLLDDWKLAQSPKLAALRECGLNPGQLREGLLRIAANSDAVFPAGQVERPSLEPTRGAMLSFARDLVQLIGPKARYRQCEVLPRALAFRARLKRADKLEEPSDLAALLAMWEGFTQKSFVPQEWDAPEVPLRELRSRVFTLIESLQPVLTPWLAAWRAYVYGHLVPILVEARDRVQEVRRREALLNYQDLLLLAARLLREHPGVRRALQEKFRWLLVDEFQDTDPLQAEILFWLAAQEDARDWHQVRLRPGALFIVGDPKQSIYRFRRADIDTYQTVRRRIAEHGGQVLPLVTSFRSQPALLKWTNRVFSELFGSGGPAQAAHQPLEPAPDSRPGIEPVGVRTLIIPPVTNKFRVGEVEAREIAAFIASEVTAGRRSWGDFLVLTRVKRPLQTIARALEAQGIPYEATGGSDFSESGSVKLLAELLAVLTDPEDSLRLVGLLRGPLFGLSDAELYLFRRAGGRFVLPEKPIESDDPVVGSLNLLVELRTLTLTLPPVAAVERVLEKTGLLARAVTLTRGGAEAGRLWQALDLVRRAEQQGGALAEGLRALQDALESHELESVALEAGKRNVVRIMNLHQAKGLEANVVFLAAPTSNSGFGVDLVIMRQGSEVVGYLEIKHRYQTLAHPDRWTELQKAESVYLEAEDRRLLYVAATRAAELLVVSRFKESRSPWGEFEPFLEASPPLPASNPPPVPEPTLESLSAYPDESEYASRWQDLSRPAYRRRSVTAAVREGQSQALWAALDTPEQAGPDGGAAWGVVIHRLLEHCMRHPDASRQDVARLTRWLTHSDPDLAGLVEEAVETVETVRASDFWRQAMEAGERLVEVPFALAQPGEDGTPTVYYGVLDLALKQREGWEVIDYKTDRRALDELVERYAGQVLTYADLWRHLTGDQVRYAGLFGVREGRLSQDLR